jgi:SHS2 domain-containing protein
MSYRWGEHVGELELHVEASDAAAVFADAVRALGELLDDEDRGTQERFDVSAEAGDRAGLFAAWLEEINFLAESEGVVPAGVEDLVLEPERVRGTVRGYRGSPPHLVKAVTYHRLSFEPCQSGWRATAVLDV